MSDIAAKPTHSSHAHNMRETAELYALDAARLATQVSKMKPSDPLFLQLIALSSVEALIARSLADWAKRQAN